MRQRQRQGVDKGPEEGLQPSAARQHEPKLPRGFFLGHIRGSTPSLHRLHVARVYADLHPPFPDTPLATPAKRGAHWDAPFIELRTKGPKIVNEEGKEVW